MPFIILVAIAVMPGIIPMMLGIGMPGFPTGDTFRDAIFFLFRTLSPQNVKKMWTSFPIAAAVVPIMNAGYTMSREPFESMMHVFAFAVSCTGMLSFCTVIVAMQAVGRGAVKRRKVVFQGWFSAVGIAEPD